MVLSQQKKHLLVQEKYLVQSKDFFDKHGEEYYFARFYLYSELLSYCAGIVTMDKKVHTNVISSFLWSFTLIFAGHYLYGFYLSNRFKEPY
jgi:membrane-associated protein